MPQAKSASWRIMRLGSIGPLSLNAMRTKGRTESIRKSTYREVTEHHCR